MTIRPAGLSARRVLSVLTAVAAVTLAATAPASAAPAIAPASAASLAWPAGTASLVSPARAASLVSPASMTLCRSWQSMKVTGTDGQRYVIRNKPSVNHDDQGMCLSDPSRHAGFIITRSPGTAASPKVRAYPYIANGCFEGACAAGGEGPMPRAGSLGNYTVSWATVTPPESGVWNVSLDLWLGPRRGVGTSEIMIWLKYSKPSWWAKRYPSVEIDGAKWYLVPHTTAPGRHYISFRRASPVESATLLLAPFMAEAERLGDLSPSALLWCAQAGFEIWSGGRGLQITRFSITRLTPDRKPPHHRPPHHKPPHRGSVPAPQPCRKLSQPAA
jgi:hypothetical protein